MTDYKHLSTHDRRHSRELNLGTSTTLALVIEAMFLAVVLALCTGPWPQ